MLTVTTSQDEVLNTICKAFSGDHVVDHVGLKMPALWLKEFQIFQVTKPV